MVQYQPVFPGELLLILISGTNGATTQNFTGLAAGFYGVTVTDAASATATRNLTLTEPTQLTLSITPSVYNGSFNISLNASCNGYINSSVSGGTTAYSYLWSSGQTTANITNLCAGVYTITITDAMACTVHTTQSMTEPDKASWDLTGNANTNSSTQFIGTTDNRDVVLKANNSEAFRIIANGQLQFIQGTLKVDTAVTDSARAVYVDQGGILKVIGPGTGGPQPCKTITNRWWTDYCNATNDIYNYPSSGNVGIGLMTPYEKLHVQMPFSAVLQLWALQVLR